MTGRSTAELAETARRLDAAYPNGWRCGHETTDGLTLLLADGLRQMLEALFPPTRR